MDDREWWTVCLPRMASILAVLGLVVVGVAWLLP